jgi:hypothetical protein
MAGQPCDLSSESEYRECLQFASTGTVHRKSPDNFVYDITNQPGFPIGISAKGWGHPICNAAATTIAENYR